MLRDFRSFSNRFGTVDPGQELPVEDQILAFADPPRHSRQRKLLTAALSASRVEHLHEAMQQTVDGLLDAIIATGSPDFELISSLASPFPALTTAELMGVPHELGNVSRTTRTWRSCPRPCPVCTTPSWRSGRS